MSSEDRLSQLLKAEAEVSFSPAGHGMSGIERRVRARRRARTMRRIGAPVVVAAAAAAIAVSVFAGGSLRKRIETVPATTPTTAAVSSTLVPTTTLAPTTTTVAPTTSTTISLAGAATALNAYLADEPSVAEHSAPVRDGSSVIAVAALNQPPDARPVQVLGWDGTRWSQITDLALPHGQPECLVGCGTAGPNTFFFVAGGTVSVADVTGDGRPDFLLAYAAADNVPGLVVSQDGADGGWRFVAHTGAAGLTLELARDPVFQGGRLVSYYNDCVPDCASGHTSPVYWTYNRSRGYFVTTSPNHN